MILVRRNEGFLFSKKVQQVVEMYTKQLLLSLKQKSRWIQETEPFRHVRIFLRFSPEQEESLYDLLSGGGPLSPRILRKKLEGKFLDILPSWRFCNSPIKETAL